MRLGAVAFAILLGACKKDECEAGFELRDDGLCYEAGGDDGALQAVFDALPACEPLAADGALDLSALCAGPGCAGDSYADLEAAYGGGDCGSIGGGRVECTWSDWDVIGNFFDPDGDGQVDAGQYATGLFVGASFPGATDDGLGAGVSVDCFLDAFGLPTSMEPNDNGDELWIFWWGFELGSFYVVDTLREDGAPGGDGIVDYVWLNGPE